MAETEMVERVARDIKARVPVGYGMTDGEALEYARAAIEAMREPTEAMQVAGGLKYETMLFEGESTGVIFKDVGIAFTSMIDAALSPPGKA